MMLDLNEKLFIKAISKLHVRNSGSLCSLKELKEDMDLDEEFFIASILGMEKKKAIEIGFVRRKRILKVANWHSKYKERDDFYLKITKRGLLQA